MAAGSPSSKRYTDHGYGKPASGSPQAIGAGIGSGPCEAITGGHRCSLSTCLPYQAPLGSRTVSSEPSRKLRLSQPSSSTAVIGEIRPLRELAVDEAARERHVDLRHRKRSDSAPSGGSRTSTL